MDVVPITVFDKAKLKKELFEMVYQNPNLFLPKNKGISVMEISLQELIDSCGTVVCYFTYICQNFLFTSL